MFFSFCVDFKPILVGTSLVLFLNAVEVSVLVIQLSYINTGSINTEHSLWHCLWMLRKSICEMSPAVMSTARATSA